jgi:hypothetical protein
MCQYAGQFRGRFSRALGDGQLDFLYRLHRDIQPLRFARLLRERCERGPEVSQRGACFPFRAQKPPRPQRAVGCGSAAPASGKLRGGQRLLIRPRDRRPKARHQRPRLRRVQ